MRIRKVEQYNRIKQISEEQNCTWSAARYKYEKEIGKIKLKNTYTTLTKQDLLDYGITNVTEDGKVFIGDTELKQKIHDKYITVIASSFPRGHIHLHRILYVWYIGEQPAGMVIDHKDENKLNNSLDNLQLLTRGENIKKSKEKRIKDDTYYVKNQFTKDLSIDELKERKANKALKKEKYKQEKAISKEKSDLKKKLINTHSITVQERADAMQQLNSKLIETHKCFSESKLKVEEANKLWKQSIKAKNNNEVSADYVKKMRDNLLIAKAKLEEDTIIWKDAINAKKQFIADNPKINFQEWLKINC